jgi:hypothetical protein
VSMKTNVKIRTAKRIALSSILCSLGVLFLYLGSVLEVFDLTMGAFASIIIIFSVIEMGGKSPYLIYAATSFLSMLIIPNKFSAVLYLTFAGIYPILKEKFERLHYIISWILKLSVFNSSLLLIIFITKYMFHIPETDLDFTWLVFAVGNATFILYDVALTKIITFYLVKIRDMLKLKNYFEN